jgi:tetratricopeptide (TPR) repeat protein
MVSVCMLTLLITCPESKAEPAPRSHLSEDRLAEKALMEGRIDESVARAQSLIQTDPADAAPRLILCGAYFAEEMIDDSITSCEAALTVAPDNSQIEDWLGRAYGRKADRSGPIAGFELAHRVKNTFEAAVEHDPHNIEAVNDLSEYYVSAPAVVGGGVDKADALADRVAPYMPQQAHRIRGLAAEKRRDYGTADREYHAEIEVGRRPEAWVDLANFYKRRHDDGRALEAVRHCLEADRMHDASIVDAAGILDELQLDPALEQQMLRLYLAGNAKSDDAPVIHVDVLLSKMLLKAGSKSAAKIELKDALGLAANYMPAKHALRDL